MDEQTRESIGILRVLNARIRIFEDYLDRRVIKDRAGAIRQVSDDRARRIGLTVALQPKLEQLTKEQLIEAMLTL